METDETMDATIARVGGTLVDSIAASTKRRRRWAQGATALGGAAVLFVAGVLVGGAVSPVPKATGSTITIACYNTTDPAQATDIDEYTSTQDLATAKSHVTAACNKTEKSQTMIAQVEEYANQLNQTTGATCGILNATDGTEWNFGFYPISKKNTGGAGWLAEGKPSAPLAADCITKSITVTTWLEQPMAMCTVNATKYKVYPRGTHTEAEVCESEGLAVAG